MQLLNRFFISMSPGFKILNSPYKFGHNNTLVLLNSVSVLRDMLIIEYLALDLPIWSLHSHLSFMWILGGMSYRSS